MTTTRPFELLHMDLFGPTHYATLTNAASLYGFVIVDDYSTYTWVHIIVYKTEVQEIFKRFSLRASTNFGIKIKHIRSDDGTEFKNTGLDDYPDELGITHELSAPYTPQQNGVVERKNMTLVEMARTMLEEYQTPRRFCPEAINTACHIINRVYLHKFLKKTSYELLTDKKPNVSYFKVFGAKCWIRDPHHSSKFAPKAHEDFMLGYGKDSHTYRVFNNYHNKVVETVDVRFDETTGSQREQLPSDPNKLSPEEAIKLKPTEDIVPTEEIDEETIPITDENQEDAPKEIAPEPLPQPRLNPQPAHPRIANEVELDKILNDINAPGTHMSADESLGSHHINSFATFLEENLQVSSESSRVQSHQQNPQLKKMEDDRKQKGGKKLEQNTALDIPEDIYLDYCTPDENETMAKRKIRLQKIERRWAKEWKEYRFVTAKYAKKFALKPPRKRAPLEAHQVAHPSSLKTLDDYPDEKDKHLAKLKKQADVVVRKFNESSAIASTTATSSAAETSGSAIPQPKSMPSKPRAPKPQEKLAQASVRKPSAPKFPAPPQKPQEKPELKPVMKPLPANSSSSLLAATSSETKSSPPPVKTQVSAERGTQPSPSKIITVHAS
ncbi:hypothetical protein ZWY2020_024223 [Hordeum vulgare]|nr:hypothetical protein ZWY2020_024223 [Hordeum vulgare]